MENLFLIKFELFRNPFLSISLYRIFIHQYIYQMQREQYNAEEIYSQGRRVSEYMNLTDILTEKQKQQVVFY